MELDLATGLVLWFALAAVIVYWRWKRRVPGAGLVSAYLLYLAWIHWVPAALYALPSYLPLYPEQLVKLGFDQSLLGVATFGLGAVLVGPALVRRLKRLPPTTEPVAPLAQEKFSRLPLGYWLFGLSATFIFTPLFSAIPTVGALVGGWGNVLCAGWALLCWQAWRARHYGTLIVSLCATLAWPLMTVAGQGFLGAGLTLPIMISLFVARMQRRPYLIGIMLIATAYVGVSVAVNYSINRDYVRSIVWSETTGILARLDATKAIFEDFQWFDVNNLAHLNRVESHTNQNFLAGSAIARLTNGTIDYAQGATIGDALLMLVPRALWPDKQVRMGGDSYVVQYAGVSFSGGTSVGMGQVMEFYVNFGSLGVALGFLLLGVIMSLFDQVAATYLWRGDWPQFVLWYVPAISLLQTGNNLLALVAGAVVSWVAVYIFNWWWVHNRSHRPERPQPRTDLA